MPDYRDEYLFPRVKSSKVPDDSDRIFCIRKEDELPVSIGLKNYRIYVVEIDKKGMFIQRFIEYVQDLRLAKRKPITFEDFLSVK